MPQSHGRRRHTLRAHLREQSLDAMLITDLLNIRYLTGFTGSNAALLVHAGDEPDGERRTIFCTDGRYSEQAAAEVPDLETVVDRPSAAALAGRIAADAATHRRTGFESHHVTVDSHEGLVDTAGSVELVRTPHLVETLRMVKDADEIAAIGRACDAADRALADLIANGGLRPGRTELEVARDLEARMQEHGAVGPSFETIIAAGPNSAIPHHSPGGAVLAAGDLVKMDFGAHVDGYNSDMTRTVVLGAPADWQREIYELVLASQLAGCEAVQVGADVREIDTLARKVIDNGGHGDRFVHSLGHGIGLEVHEAPSLSQRGDGTLDAGMAVTVEPGVYLPGRGGVRIEDTLVVRSGAAEPLTLTTKELVSV